MSSFEMFDDFAVRYKNKLNIFGWQKINHLMLWIIKHSYVRNKLNGNHFCFLYVYLNRRYSHYKIYVSCGEWILSFFSKEFVGIFYSSQFITKIDFIRDSNLDFGILLYFGHGQVCRIAELYLVMYESFNNVFN